MSALSEVDCPLYGIHRDAVQYQNLERLQEINERVASRFVPDAPLAPNFSFRPVMTKYTVFPMLDNRMPTTEPVMPNYAPSGVFAPPLEKVGPVAKYMRNVDIETDLRNQMQSLERNTDQSAYVPAAASDLYRVAAPKGLGTGANAAHGLLFQQFRFDSPVSALDANVGGELLHNSTRTQMRT
jgi:hypothetical protein